MSINFLAELPKMREKIRQFKKIKKLITNSLS